MTEDYTGTVTASEDELDLLACCLNGWDADDLDITIEDFDQPRHRDVWLAIRGITESGSTPSPVTVRLALGPDGDRAATWLMDVFGRPVAPANAPALAARIRRAAQLRDLQDLARALMQRASADDPDPAAITEWARGKLDAPVGINRQTTTVAETFPRVLDELEGGHQAGLGTPWFDLDRKIHGLASDRLYIVAARPGIGKSLLGQNLAWHWSTVHKLPTYFASLEMAANELTTRVIAQVSHVAMDNLQSASLTEADWDKIGKIEPLLSNSMIHICEDPAQTLETIRSGARQMQRRQNLGLVVVDYLQLVTPRDRKAPREQQVAEVSRGLKLLAKELHVPVVAMSQVRRLHDGEKNRRPTLSDLRESGAIEQDADAVMILHVPDEEQPWDAELFVAKARAGSKGVVELTMRTHWATIDPAERRTA